MVVNTRNVKDRRDLRFSSLDEVLADTERIAAADRAGTLRRTGNWTAGQTLSHLATWINFGFDGYPPDLPPMPWLMRQVVKLMKNRFLYKPLPAGFTIRGVKGGTLGTDDVPVDQALTKLRAAAARLNAGPPQRPNVVFGPMTHAEWTNLHLRHAELHLSFLHP